MNMKKWAVAAAMLSTGVAQATCYSLYWSDGKLLTETSIAPVDLSLPLGEALNERFGPDVTMVVSDQGVFCGKQEVVPVGHLSLADAVRAAGEQAAVVKKAQVATAGATTQLR
jgi:hypothetical protein